jgi:hypothetical protein
MWVSFHTVSVRHRLLCVGRHNPSNVNGLSLASQRIKHQISHLRAITMSLEMILMEGEEKRKGKCSGDDAVKPDLEKSLEVQFVLSLAIGVSAFFLFCVCPPHTRMRIHLRSCFEQPNAGDR